MERDSDAESDQAVGEGKLGSGDEKKGREIYILQESTKLLKRKKLWGGETKAKGRDEEKESKRRASSFCVSKNF